MPIPTIASPGSGTEITSAQMRMAGWNVSDALNLTPSEISSPRSSIDWNPRL